MSCESMYPILVANVMTEINVLGTVCLFDTQLADLLLLLDRLSQGQLLPHSHLTAHYGTT